MRPDKLCSPHRRFSIDNGNQGRSRLDLWLRRGRFRRNRFGVLHSGLLNLLFFCCRFCCHRVHPAKEAYERYPYNERKANPCVYLSIFGFFLEPSNLSGSTLSILSGPLSRSLQLSADLFQQALVFLQGLVALL